MAQIEIDLGLFTKIERGTHTGRVKVTRKGKTFWREQRIGQKSPREGTGKIAGLPDNIKNEILTLRGLGDSAASIKSQIETIIDASDDPKLRDDLAAKGILKSSSGSADLNVTAQSLVDWAKARGVESPTKRRTVKEVASEAKASSEAQFKKANEKLAGLQVENGRLKDQLEKVRKSKMESDAIREKLMSENYILREKLKSAE